MNGLTWELSWDTRGGEAELARGELLLRLGAEVVWGRHTEVGPRGLQWTWVDLLEHLARVWPRLEWQPMPFGLVPDAVAGFRALARERAAGLDPDEVEEFEQAAFDFSESHDLSFGVPGAKVPSLWVVVEGERACVATAQTTRWLPRAESLDALEQLGEAIAGRLALTRHPRAVSALGAWAERHRTAESPQALYTGWDPEALRGLGPHLTRPKARFRPSEVTALARAVRGVMPARELRRVLDAVRDREPSRTVGVPRFEGVLGGRPHEQGAELARWLRASLGLAERRVDPEALLRAWDVHVVRLALRDARHVDALAAWGEGKPPVVVLNTAGAHASSVAGQRAALAHEACHLLVDAGQSLPLAEALGGPMPRDLEQRARAFAAEFLAPARAVAALYDGDALATVKQVAARFGVSREIVAWQLRNAGLPLAAAERARLRGLVSRPQGF